MRTRFLTVFGPVRSNLELVSEWGKSEDISQLEMINCGVFKCKFRLKVSMKGFDSDIFRNSKWTSLNFFCRGKMKNKSTYETFKIR